MRGADVHQEGLFSNVSAESRIPKSHPLRPVRAMVEDTLGEMSAHFERAYSEVGRPSIAPEKLVRALLLQIFYSIRSERVLARARRHKLTSDEHFTVDGTLI